MGRKRSQKNLAQLRDSIVVSAQTSKAMRANRSSGTKPEIELRQKLRAAGLCGYRINYSKLPGSPDVCFTRNKLCIFLHGCFWHGCPKCGAQTIPKLNSRYWREKFRRNKQRDLAQLAALRTMGYAVLVYWNCEWNLSSAKIVRKIRRKLDSRRLLH